mmetsp:Transcript_37875/g.95787  ORF Transcript_37875/g.95787 Transcript_37875/m.95787 type:complete len:288 (+) Transcript_37875:1732-2595(+)
MHSPYCCMQCITMRSTPSRTSISRACLYSSSSGSSTMRSIAAPSCGSAAPPPPSSQGVPALFGDDALDSGFVERSRPIVARSSASMPAARICTGMFRFESLEVCTTSRMCAKKIPHRSWMRCVFAMRTSTRRSSANRRTWLGRAASADSEHVEMSRSEDIMLSTASVGRSRVLSKSWLAAACRIMRSADSLLELSAVELDTSWVVVCGDSRMRSRLIKLDSTIAQLVPRLEHSLCAQLNSARMHCTFFMLRMRASASVGASLPLPPPAIAPDPLRLNRPAMAPFRDE